MSLIENKTILRSYMEEVITKGNLDAVDKYFAPDCIDHTAPPGTASGAGGVKQLLTLTLVAFSNIQVTTEDIIAEEDKVASRFTFQGTHTGEFMGIAPTGREVTVMQISIDRIADGKIVEHWGLVDQLSLLQQLGIGPLIG